MSAVPVRWSRVVWRLLIVPSAAYLAGFAALTWPLMESFPTRYFCDAGDGLQNLWNLWWFETAVAGGADPWRTTLLHHPHGTTLIGHTLSPFNAAAAIPLRAIAGPVAAFNTLVVSGFVGGGVAAFWLCRRFGAAYGPALLGGAAFTFCNYHFAHAEGHLNLVSVQFLPLFLLAYHELLHRPRPWVAAAAAGVLCLVLMCDLYYAYYCVLAGAVMTLFRARAAGDLWLPLRAEHRTSAAVFVGLSTALCGPLAVGLAWSHLADPLQTGHSGRDFGCDLLAPLIPGSHWRFADLTEPYWSRLRGNRHESSVHMGLALIALTAWAWRNRARLADGPAGAADLRMWFAAGAVFFVLALGPRLHVWGWRAPFVLMPQWFLEQGIPILKIARTPVRMMLVVQLAAAVIGARALTVMLRGADARTWAVVAAGLSATAVEYLPAPLPTFPPEPPACIRALADLPGAAVLDLAGEGADPLFRQTVHGQPIAFGYISREPASVTAADAPIRELVAAGRWGELRRRYDFGYVVSGTPQASAELIPVAADGGLWVYRIDG